MNVFALHPNPAFSAVCLADQHVVKMCLESTQIASTALHLNGVEHVCLYRPTHKRHPCTVAAATDPNYFWWLVDHGLALAGEYLHRFGKEHASLNRLKLAARHAPQKRPLGLVLPTTWPLAMPDAYKGENPHEAYTAYLRAKYAAWASEGRPPRWKRIVPNNPFADLDVR